MSEKDAIVVRGARMHNLRDVDVDVPRGALTVVTGPSGSGKSSLAFDTIYAEAQRRYVESLQTYARQFLEQLPKPDVDVIEGLSPAIAVRQEVPARNPRSTVGTVTEIHDFVRVLYARVGQPHCPICGRPVSAWTVPEMVDRTLSLGEGARVVVQAPIARGVIGDLAGELARLRKDGFVRVVIDGAVRDLGETITLDAKVAHDLDVQVDRLVVKDGVRQRLSDSIELGLRLGGGIVRVVPQDGEPMLFTERHACPVHLVLLPPISPRTFSWNSPEGACPTCGGLGELERFDEARVVPDASKSIAEGAIAAWGAPREKAYRDRVTALKKAGIDVDATWSELAPEMRDAVLNGLVASKKKIEGVLASLERQWIELDARRGEDDDEALEGIADELSKFRARGTCPTCGGARLRAEALGVTVGGLSIRALEALSIDDARAHVDALALEGRQAEIAEPLLREVRSRLRFLADVGVGYLSLDRSAGTLSSGEAQRIRLATRIGHALVGVLYVLDEPSIGLHPRDTGRLIETIRRLRDRGSTVLVVEHDLDVVRAADRVIDMGPGAGTEGGRVIAIGTPDEIARDERSLTGAFLSRKRRVGRARKTPRAPRGWINIRGATLHNLVGVDARVPVGVLTAVTGVSGAGKSSLVVGTLLEAARQLINGARGETVRATVEGLDAFDRVIAIDDRPIGRTPRSNPATYSGIFGPLRELFASLPEARARGWDAGRFSFNQKGGRCETCKGEGVVRIDMQFLPDVLATCEVCGGRRYDRETLDVKWRGLSIADVLDLTVSEARDLLGAVPAIRERLDAIASVGLGYLTLGQSATTLSGGEAQRLALARELARRATGRTLYVLDEPTTGLHLADVDVLIGVLEDLVEQGNTVVLIEHALEVVAAADWVIDLGPEGGPGGGRIVVAGTPDEITKAPASHTGRLLRERA
ncbi:excinuclease ABC subunit UvrA [Sandaracinus amylolyticus]|uniref:excinuclease ABC subunit UvrA n=1 Tax=Sandaracinus amylolyticus TaxID=927083 RepID=UPI001EFFAF17|nr:excinuclease ABC subunit UvrA [Sandaracinus amylolyticus]UJR81038.1 Excinuclease ABC subunit UvrA [Sandaracinus amylolyticus]